SRAFYHRPVTELTSRLPELLQSERSLPRWMLSAVAVPLRRRRQTHHGRGNALLSIAGNSPRWVAGAESSRQFEVENRQQLRWSHQAEGTERSGREPERSPCRPVGQPRCRLRYFPVSLPSLPAVYRRSRRRHRRPLLQSPKTALGFGSARPPS